MSTARNGEEQARAAALLMEQRPDADDPELVRCLINQGFAPENAHELIAFTPLAFARRLLQDSGVTFQQRFVLSQSGKSVSSLPLASEKAYRAACSVAEQFFASRGEGHDLMAVAGRSAELRAINALLNKGSKLGNIVMSEPMVDLPLRAPRRRHSLWETIQGWFRA